MDHIPAILTLILAIAAGFAVEEFISRRRARKKKPRVLDVNTLIMKGGQPLKPLPRQFKEKV